MIHSTIEEKLDEIIVSHLPVKQRLSEDISKLLYDDKWIIVSMGLGIGRVSSVLLSYASGSSSVATDLTRCTFCIRDATFVRIANVGGLVLKIFLMYVLCLSLIWAFLALRLSLYSERGEWFVETGRRRWCPVIRRPDADTRQK